MKQSWHALRLSPPRELVDPLSGLLIELGAIGTWQDGGDLVAYFPLAIHPDETSEAVRACLRHLWPGGPLPDLCWEREDEGEWITAWRNHFHPIPVGEHLMVLPEWEPDAAAHGRIPLRIRPGRGFGTGGHATTATCLKQIEKLIESNRSKSQLRVLDVGTGSGILAMAAARLGAGTVVAFDNDVDAVRNARDNLRLNGLEGRVHLFAGTIDAVSRGYDLIAANLLAHVIVDLMPHFVRLLAPGGTLLLSGILNEQGDRIEAALARSNFKVLDYFSSGIWMTLKATRS